VENPVAADLRYRNTGFKRSISPFIRTTDIPWVEPVGAGYVVGSVRPGIDGVSMESPIQNAFTHDATAVVTVLGEIDLSNADELAQSIRAAIDEWAPAAVRIDLRDATFIDSTGLGALIEGYRAAVLDNIEFAVINPSDSFRRVLTVTGLCELFGLDERVAPSETAESLTGA
jgi:anti-sigma B factor antagonist